MTDEQLAERAAAGDQEAFASLYERYKRRLFTYSWRVVGEAGLAEDAAQEALISAFRHIKRFDPARGSFRTWIFAIGHHENLHALTRKRWWHSGVTSGGQALSNDTGVGGGAPLEGMLDLEKALQVLPSKFRLPVILTKLHGLSIQECAAVLGLSEVNVKQRVFRAMHRLRRIVSPRETRSSE